MTVEFQGIAGVIGPVTGIRLESNRMCDPASGAVIAQLAHHRWQIKERYCTRWDVRGKVEVSGEAENRRFMVGTFSQVYGVNGVLWSGDQIVAQLDETTLLWRPELLASNWPTVVLRAV